MKKILKTNRKIILQLFGGRGAGSGKVKGTSYYKANKFMEFSSQRHFDDHGKNTNSKTKEEYINKAKKVANSNNKNIESFIDNKGTTYRYNYATNEFVIVTKEGEIVTYFKPRSKEKYWEGVKGRYGK